MAYFTCWDYESVTSFKKKTTRNGGNALSFCSVSKYICTQVEKFLNDAIPIFKKKFYPVKRFLTNVNIAGVLNDWNGLVWVFVSFFSNSF